MCSDEFRLELLTDIDMLSMFEKGIQGVITEAVRRYAKANNKHMNDLYNPDKVSIFPQYLDINNEYGKAMINNLPTHGFEWKNGEGLTTEKIDKPVKKDRRGYLLEVDMEYPKELHENHNELPFSVEKMKIGRVEKLVPNLKDKKRYVVHIKALNQALKHGLKVRKVHRVLRFNKVNG